MKFFSIVALLFCFLFFFTAVGSAADVQITDVKCPCGGCPSDTLAIECLCGSAIKALNDAGFSQEDIQKYLDAQRGNTG